MATRRVKSAISILIPALRPDYPVEQHGRKPKFSDIIKKHKDRVSINVRIARKVVKFLNDSHGLNSVAEPLKTVLPERALETTAYPGAHRVSNERHGSERLHCSGIKC